MPPIIADAFTQDHHRCDHLLAAVETRLGDSDWSVISTAAETLIDAMNHHFAQEEESLFPALAQVLPMAEQPIDVMRGEHAQMRQLFAELGEAVAIRDQTACQGILETLHFLVQQHNHKEEGVLYPLADNALTGRAAEFATAIADV
ncbi:hemerythrin domain-containing protein [Thiobaca trueperi]|uniref:Hemerythrin HHE cation binding domain-containing protein n=1 Tax=Thiobaca trueperi TaxID=127458 RepID=A0A4R3MVX8_9GAMM|nr:hemerythrin domain-containing protein [Thiobaca trueperi]TCT20708.1 hemerythrin HHE cation binding domain-containing protein [Thiobaca trueperi]